MKPINLSISATNKHYQRTYWWMILGTEKTKELGDETIEPEHNNL